MLLALANLNPFATRADKVLKRSVQVQRITHLVKIGNLQIGTLANVATIRRKLA